MPYNFQVYWIELIGIKLNYIEIELNVIKNKNIETE